MIASIRINGSLAPISLLVNDTQLLDLDDVIVINPNTRIVFLKILRLVGG